MMILFSATLSGCSIKLKLTAKQGATTGDQPMKWTQCEWNKVSWTMAIIGIFVLFRFISSAASDISRDYHGVHCTISLESECQ